MQSKLLASAAVQSGRPELISIAYERVCPVCRDQEIGVPRHLDTMLAKGYEYQGDWEKALQCCEKVLATDPKHLETLSIYYWNLDNVNRVDDAIRNAEYLYSLDPSRESLSYNLGYFHGKVGQLGKAGFYYLRELELEPEHGDALENLSFIHTLSTKFDEAQQAFEKSLDINRKEILDILPYLEPEDVHKVEEVFSLKSQKFSQLLEKARQLQGDSTYTLQLQELNMSGDVRIGATTAIERNPYSMDRLLSILGSGTKADVHEVLFEYGLEERGDYSIRLTELISQIPGFYDLPKEAQSSLIEGEKRFKEAGSGDFSPVIVSFSKALEICIKKLVFEPFRQKHQYQVEVTKQVVFDRKKLPRGADKFVLFIEKGHFIALGEMALILDLCNKQEMEDAPYIHHLREFLAEQKELQVLLVPEIVEKITTLAKDYRNRAVHSSTFDNFSFR